MSTWMQQPLYANENRGSRHAKHQAMEEFFRSSQDKAFHPYKNLPPGKSISGYQGFVRQGFLVPDRHNTRKEKSMGMYCENEPPAVLLPLSYALVCHGMKATIAFVKQQMLCSWIRFFYYVQDTQLLDDPANEGELPLRERPYPPLQIQCNNCAPLVFAPLLQSETQSFSQCGRQSLLLCIEREEFFFTFNKCTILLAQK